MTERASQRALIISSGANRSLPSVIRTVTRRCWNGLRPVSIYASGLVHHTDAVREYAYDRNSSVGKLDKALDEANAKGWTVVDMKNDWKTIFPAAKAAQ